MRLINLTIIKLSLIILGCISTATIAKDYFVDSKQAYIDIASNLKAGDKVILKNGTWTDFEILLQGQGTEKSPIQLIAETKGKVILSGQSNLRLAGHYLHASGLVFKNGYTPTSAVIEFRRNKSDLAYHSRVSEIVIDNYNNPDKRESDYWVALYGQRNRFDHNHLVGKRNKGVTVAVRLNSEQSQQNYHQIDHNYFGYRPTFGSNGGETLRIGTSHYSLTDSHTLVENNYFEQTNGEVEIISIKSGKNIIRNNVFFEARGTLTMRHGNGNLIEENVFFGNGVEHTGGIRVINKDQIIRNNYLEGLTGFRFGSGFTVMNGVPNSSINRYHQVENAQIENNTFVNVRHIQLAAGSDAERSAVPINSVMKNNLIINENNQQPFTVFDDVSGIKFSNNVANTKVLSNVSYGVKQQAVSLKRNDVGLLLPTSNKVKAGAKTDLTVISKAETGVAWYPKVPAIIAFDSGKTHTVKGSAQALLSAIENAASGDVLELAAGQYDVSKLIIIDKVLTIKARQQAKVTLTFQRSSLFEIHDGGSLKLDGLLISGESSPDSAGNSVVRAKKWGMVDNYRLVMMNSQLVDLDINHTFDFFTTGKGALADEITLINNKFNKVSGDILRLDSEIEDLGIYNADYVTFTDNNFSNVSGSLIKLYRGGTDESTFGPHLTMTNNTLTNVGLGKRNKSNASVYLHGVQVTNIDSNTFVKSAPIVIEHTVGEPNTMIINNTFDSTDEPSVTELRAAGPHTATLKNNKIIKN
ncbi:polysaccharide lyase 6 family protein [Pseudoalteromonas sp. SR41-4]|uniref:polysaccharide lyase 6 family protein n=1 Tax=Pseudoalteromonas sp. SR41-4 TaxID=2760950 RepID=UPI0015FFA0B3|nr:polysaccharide lyase 6 family protein [Pseudoalteromonas sp. SR41-4]MBB1291567.1 alginate lyase [Pseudoalteromonas sp. SR41-4]